MFRQDEFLREMDLSTVNDFDNFSGMDFNEELPVGQYVMILREVLVYEPNENGEKPEQEGHINGKFEFQVMQSKYGSKDWRGKIVRKYPKLYKPEYKVDQEKLKKMVQMFLGNVNKLNPDYWKAERKTVFLKESPSTVKFETYGKLAEDCEKITEKYGSWKNDNGSYDYGVYYMVNWYKTESNGFEYDQFSILGIVDEKDIL